MCHPIRACIPPRQRDSAPRAVFFDLLYSVGILYICSITPSAGMGLHGSRRLLPLILHLNLNRLIRIPLPSGPRRGIGFTRMIRRHDCSRTAPHLRPCGTGGFELLATAGEGATIVQSTPARVIEKRSTVESEFSRVSDYDSPVASTSLPASADLCFKRKLPLPTDSRKSSGRMLAAVSGFPAKHRYIKITPDW
jgi:hypothetical protein